MSKIQMFLLGASLFMISCGGSSEKATDDSSSTEEAPQSMVTDTNANADDPMADKGIGPIKSITLDPEINQEMVAKGKKLYGQLCSACHKPDQKFIGPAQRGVLDRRSPEWVMNMMMNPTEMIAKDPIAKKLLVEYNMAPMADQNLTKEQARSILEYFRTL